MTEKFKIEVIKHGTSKAVFTFTREYEGFKHAYLTHSELLTPEKDLYITRLRDNEQKSYCFHNELIACNVPVANRKAITNAYHDYVTNYLSLDVFAEHYGMHLEEAKAFILLGRQMATTKHPAK